MDTIHKFLTVSEYAVLMRVSDVTVRRLCRAGEIEGVERLGKVFRIPNPDFVAPEQTAQSA